MGPKQNIFGAKQLLRVFNSYQILSNWPASLQSYVRSHLWLDKTFAKREKAKETLINKFLTWRGFCSES